MITAAQLIKAEADEIEALQLAIGRATTEWARVERGLFFVFLYALGMPEYNTASAAYHSIINLQAKLQMIDAAFRMRFAGEPILDEWGKLLDRVRAKSGVKARNKLAHYGMAIGMQAPKGERAYLTETPNDARIDSIDKRSRLTAKKINQMRDGFYALAMDLAVFQHRIEDHLGVKHGAARLR